MKLYTGIDLHSNNSYVVIIDEKDNLIFDKRLPNDLGTIVEHLHPYQAQIENIIVESTYNWYWLVDGLQNIGYQVKLAHVNAIICYSGLKNSNDKSDARWLAKLSLLNILPSAYIYPKEERCLREVLRRRCFLVKQQTMSILSLQALLVRYYNHKISGEKFKRLPESELKKLILDDHIYDIALSQLTVIKSIHEQILCLEKSIRKHIKPSKASKNIRTVPGIGETLSALIIVESGDITRFKQVGNYASYCRRVKATKTSNDKSKGYANRRNGNPILAWVYMEAANYAIRYNAEIKRYYQRKLNKVHRISALNAVAHKLSRACYFILRDGVEFDIKKCFC
jgi:transposase